MIAYRLPNTLPWADLAGPVAAAESTLARLDERIAASPIAEGWIARSHLFAACAEAMLAGQLVHLEDLVLHDVDMDIRTPTADLTRAHATLLRRRRLAACRPAEAWALAEREALGGVGAAGEGRAIATEETGDAELDAALAAVASAITRVDATLNDALPCSALIYESDRDEAQRRESWQETMRATAQLPAVLAAAVAADAWAMLEPTQHRDALGWSLAAALLRTRGTTKLLAGPAIGMRAIPRLRWQSPDQMTRILALLEGFARTAESGRKDHERWLAAKSALDAKLPGRRSSSHLPALIDYVLRSPLVSAGMIARELRVTPRAAQNLVAELGLRELTGRGRYRAWGIL